MISEPIIRLRGAGRAPCQPNPDEGADNSHDNVYIDAEAAAVDDTTGQGTGDAANNQPEDDSMRGSMFLLLRS